MHAIDVIRQAVSGTPQIGLLTYVGAISAPGPTICDSPYYNTNVGGITNMYDLNLSYALQLININNITGNTFQEAEVTPFYNDIYVQHIENVTAQEIDLTYSGQRTEAEVISVEVANNVAEIASDIVPVVGEIVPAFHAETNTDID